MFYVLTLSTPFNAPEIYKLLFLILVLTATSVSVVRSFSVLKRIKTFSRNTISTSKLQSLSLTLIEKEFVKEMEADKKFFNPINDHFANQKDRCIKLLYKMN